MASKELTACSLTESVLNTRDSTCPETGNRVLVIEVGALAGDTLTQLLAHSLLAIVNAHMEE